MDRPAVFAEWDYGHLIQYVAGRPVLVSPFGTDVGAEAMNDFAEAFLTRDPDRLEAILEARQVGVVLLANPVTEAHFAFPYSSGGEPVVQVERHWRRGLDVRVLDGFWKTAAARLYFFDGQMDAVGRGLAMGRFRLVFESQGTEEWNGIRSASFKVFERVAGAVLVVSGLRAGVRATAQLELRYLGRSPRRWRTSHVADAEGVARLVVPYGTGANGMMMAEPYRVLVGDAAASVVVPEQTVLTGGKVHVQLAPPPGGLPR